MQSIAVYLNVQCACVMCLVKISEYRSALHAMTSMGGAAASETLIEGYIWTIGGCSTRQKQPRENAVLHWKRAEHSGRWSLCLLAEDQSSPPQSSRTMHGIAMCAIPIDWLGRLVAYASVTCSLQFYCTSLV